MISVSSHCILCCSSKVERYFEKTKEGKERRIYERCLDCHLIFLNSACRIGQAAEKARYDLHQNSPEDSRYVDFLKKLIDPFLLKLRPGFRGLDFGCGPGPAIEAVLKKHGYDVDNYDPIYYPHQTLLERRYDFITCTEVIEHFYAPRREFLRFDRLLKPPNSYLGLMTQEFHSGIDFSTWWYQREPSHVCFYSRRTFEWIANWMGWGVEFPRKNVIIFLKQTAPYDIGERRGTPASQIC